MVMVHALGCLLGASRKLYLRLFRDERQSTLLEGLASALEYFEGVAARVVVDNMATAVLGRFGSDRKVLWHPRLLDFARHYGFEPFACRPRDPDRKGKKEKSFRLVFDDFIKGTDFESWDNLDARRRIVRGSKLQRERGSCENLAAMSLRTTRAGSLSASGYAPTRPLPRPGLGSTRGLFFARLGLTSSACLSCSIDFCSLMSLSTTRLTGAPPVPCPELDEGSCGVVAVSRAQNVVPSAFTLRSSHVFALHVVKSSLRCR